jgi:hypothetical protein
MLLELDAINNIQKPELKNWRGFQKHDVGKAVMIRFADLPVIPARVGDAGTIARHQSKWQHAILTVFLYPLVRKGPKRKK